jgi:hypothetical protein
MGPSHHNCVAQRFKLMPFCVGVSSSDQKSKAGGLILPVSWNIGSLYSLIFFIPGLYVNMLVVVVPIGLCCVTEKKRLKIGKVYCRVLGNVTNIPKSKPNLNPSVENRFCPHVPDYPGRRLAASRLSGRMRLKLLQRWSQYIDYTHWPINIDISVV